MRRSLKDRKSDVLQKLKKQKIRSLKDLEDYKLSVCHPNSAGIDLGSREIYVAVNPDIAAELGEPIVKIFSTFTSGLKECCEWLKYCGITDVSMESTSVYWKNIYDMLEDYGMTPCLVNPRKFRMVPGRKTDVLDCQWLQTLHMYGLLSGSFVPQGHIRQLRSYMRYRDTLIKDRTRSVQRMQKNLVEMNLMLVNVISDITGKTGLRIIDAILSGERDGKVLAKLRHTGCLRSEEEIAEGLDGHYKEDQLYLLRLNYENFKHLDAQIVKLDTQIANLLDVFPVKENASLKEDETETDTTAYENTPAAEAKKKKRRSTSKNDLRIKNLPDKLIRIAGTDLTTITGLQSNTILQIMAEVGTDMSKFPTAKHFASYLGFVPRNKITGGVIISSSTDRLKNPASQAFRKVVPSLIRGKSALAAFYHRIVSKGAPGKAIVAVCRKLAMIYYNTLVYGKEFVEKGAEDYKKKQKDRERMLIARLARKHNLLVSEVS